MKCEADYCIYNDRLTCILTKIEIDSIGMCSEYIKVIIPNKALQRLKEKQLRDIEAMWKAKQ